MDSQAARAETRPIVTVFGSARPQEGEPAWDEAYAVGRRIAEAGWTLCNGGTSGTMQAAARGAREAGGRTLGVTMDIYIGDTPNGWLDEEVRVADLFTRLQRLIGVGLHLPARRQRHPGGVGADLDAARVRPDPRRAARPPRAGVAGSARHDPRRDAAARERLAARPGRGDDRRRAGDPGRADAGGGGNR